MTACPQCGAAVDHLDVEFTYASGEVRAGGRRVTMRQMHLRILECLIDSYPRALASTALFESIYSDREDPPTYAALHTQVRQMRDAIEAAGLPFRVISVSAGAEHSGYMLVPELHKLFVQKVA